MPALADSSLEAQVIKGSRKIEKGTVAYEYLSKFNINLDRDYGQDCVYIADLWHPVMAQAYGAVVYKLRNNEGAVSRYWITYLQPDGELAVLEKDNQRLSPNTICPAFKAGKSHSYWATPLKKDETRLRICFNPLDALVLSDTEGEDCSVCVTSEDFKTPERVQEVEIYCRHSRNYRMEKIIYTLAYRLQVDGVNTEILWPRGDVNRWCER